MNTIVDILKEMALKPDFTKVSDHQERMQRILGRPIVDTVTMEKYRICQKKFYDLNFRFIVKPEFAFKFKYHASIMGHSILTDRIYDDIVYDGDIPDFVLDNIERIRQIENSPYITVHSNEELPYALSPTPHDPVAIWWGWPTQFILGGKGLELRYNHKPIGAVIGIWDGEKEVSIL